MPEAPLPDLPPTPPSDPLVYLLGLSFQQLLHTFLDRLAVAGYPDLRPIHGFTLRCVAREGATSVEIAAHLGVTKQAAGQLVAYLEAHGYVERQPHRLGGRRRLVVLSARGRQHLADADVIMRRVEAEWAAPVGPERLDTVRDTLAILVRRSGPDGALPPLRPIW